MKVSRRKFLGAATGSAATLMSFGPLRWSVAGPRARSECALIDLPHCVLRESLHGYQNSLGEEHAYLSAANLDAQRDWRTVIVPSLGLIDLIAAQSLSNAVQQGALLVVESGGGFLSPPEFAAHQKMLRRCFDLRIERPVDLWGGTDRQHPRTPYVSYVWPCVTLVRDFSRVLPVSASSGDVIATVGNLPVALKKRVGQGTLIFLGSPLGPLLHAGDPEARSWLEAVRTF